VTRIKICGITTVEDALAAVELGADAIGLHFAETPRNVSPERAEEIAQALPPFVSVVGVFTREDPEILQYIGRCGLTAVQLHGDQSEEYARAIGLYRPVIRVARLKDEESLSVLHSFTTASAVLVDAYCDDKLGGTGRTFDWSLAIRARELGRPLILAGGLGPDNVAEAVRVVRPYAVDASSRLEWAPGRKDPEKMKEFIRNVRAADEAS